MLNLYKILALGIIVTKARISFQLVMPVLWFPHVDVQGGMVSDGPEPSHCAHTRTELLHMELLQENDTVKIA